ncbi:hypothetical protein P6144_18980 [Sphingomonas sp. HITSZ_GF]|uniref:hypothetical protein n=1 Tax=Sphingomonas sp. HITSZ_GF TaxID=3037247 RepID=UPI00240E0CD0|nr:hypothetical protein [Sphingomonas sp. HITSZ_GF]MDG2535753.1 hypothetical protein [Sphingomonas sp. HITSZ_GF]
MALVVTFLALTPGPMGQVVESGPARHLLAFAALPVLSSLAWPQVKPIWQFLAFALFGAAIEIAQLLMNVGRLAEWDDWANDLIATAVALMLVAAGRTWLERQARLEAR